MKTVELIGVYKSYHKKEILKNINYIFESHKCYLLVGNNGSGKSTLIKIMCKINNPTKGKVIVSSEKVGYVPERITFPEYIRVIDFLMNIGNIKKLQEEKLNDKINDYLIKWNIEDIKNKKLGELSKGMLQKVLIIQALLQNERIYIFDEPLNGLDQKSRSIFFKEIKELKQNGSLIIISSHYPKSYLKSTDYILRIVRGEIHEKANRISL